MGSPNFGFTMRINDPIANLWGGGCTATETEGPWTIFSPSYSLAGINGNCMNNWGGMACIDR
jgi:hypothetical protein